MKQTATIYYVVEFAEQPPTDLELRVGAIAAAPTTVEPVFRNDPRFWRICLAGVDRRWPLELSPFDEADRLRRALGARSVEPDLPTDFFPEPPPEELKAGGRESTDALGCWVGDSEPAPPSVDWALRNIRVPEAWQFSRQQGRPACGEGILIAQPDTGITDHPELADAIDKTRWADVLDGGDPIDPLIKDDPLDTPGHGTGTGSVVISREAGHVTGSAPAAQLVPIRCIESVARITQSRVARAIEHAVDSGCHVVTMSLGGLWSRALAAAVERAIDSNLIVMAAAGNCVRTVVWPARFDRCIAVAGSNVHDTTWKGSCSGDAVDITAPAQHVYRASRRPDSVDPAEVGPGEGTSFAVALTAGVAAMWLAHHGRHRLIESLGPGERLQDRFARLLRRTARVPNGWGETAFGAGVVDALVLLRAGIGTSEALVEAAPHRAGTPLGADQAEAARELLAASVGGAEAVALDHATLEAHGLELIWLTLEHARRPAGMREAAGGGPILSAALREALARAGNAGLAENLGAGPLSETESAARLS